MAANNFPFLIFGDTFNNHNLYFVQCNDITCVTQSPVRQLGNVAQITDTNIRFPATGLLGTDNLVLVAFFGFSPTGLYTAHCETAYVAVVGVHDVDALVVRL